MSTPARVFADRYSLDVQVSTSVGTPVWRAMDQVLKRWVTIYVMPRSDVRSPAVIAACHKAAAMMPRSGVAIIDIVEQGTIRGIPTISAAQEHLGIITEWTEGEGLDRRILRRSEPMPTDAAIRVTSRIASVLEQAHSRGLHHSRLRPHNIVFDDNDDMRVTGFGVESSMLGPDRSNGVQADVQGLGNLLFAMVTGKWPDGQADGLPSAAGDGAIPRPSAVNAAVSQGADRFFLGTQDGTIVTIADALRVLADAAAPVTAADADGGPDSAAATEPGVAAPIAAAPTVAPAPPAPHLPPVIDEPANSMPTVGEIAASLRSLVSRRPPAKARPTARAVPAPKPGRSTEAPRPAPRRESRGGLRSRTSALPTITLPKRARRTDRPLSDRPLPSPSPQATPSKSAPLPVLAVPDTSLWHPEVAETRKRAILIAFISVLLFGWLGWRMLTLNVGQGPVATPTVSSEPSVSASPSASPSTAARTATVIGARDYDPYGDGGENPAKAARAIDGNPKTAWQTSRYPQPLSAIKPGVGLVLNLGSAQQVGTVRIAMSAPGASVSVYVANQASPKQRAGQLLGSVANGDANIVISNSTGLTGRYVLVWLTGLPKAADGGYQAGIYEVTVELH